MNLLIKDTKWYWSKEASEAFEEMKKALASSDILKYLVLGQRFKLATDASAYGVAAELFQGCWDPEEGEHKTIAFASRCLTTHGWNYSTTKKELLAIVWAIKKFQNIIWGSKIIV